MKVLVVGPDLNDLGGVANFYNAVFPKLSTDAVETSYLEIGSTKGGGNISHVVTDHIRFWLALNSFKPDIVHLNPSLDFRSFFRDGLFIFASKLQSRKVLVFFRGWQSKFEARMSGPLMAFFRVTYARADAFIVLAQKFSDSLRGWGVTAPVSVGSTTVDEKLLLGFSIDEKVSKMEASQTVRLLYLARLEREKGVLQLIRAVEILLKSGAAVSLTIAGEGPVHDEIQTLISTLGECSNSISLIGYVRGEEKSNILSTHHIFCFPTQYGEGMPNSVLEAMAFGLAVVTCPVGGIADFFETRKMGVLLSGNDPRLIASGIAFLLKDRTQLVDAAKYNYAYAQQRFLASTVAAFLRERYAEIRISK